jgi:hypothetical protein
MLRTEKIIKSKMVQLCTRKSLFYVIEITDEYRDGTTATYYKYIDSFNGRVSKWFETAEEMESWVS